MKIDLGGSFATLLTILFIGLKLGKVIAWSWLWVLCPIWISIGIVVLILLIILAIAGIAAMFKD